MRSSKHTFNGNVAFMLQKYRISHMIAAFHYEEVHLCSGEFRSQKREEGKPWTLPGQTFPWELCHDLSDSLWQMAGWDSGDNKCVYLVIQGGEPTLIGFYDSKCTLVRFSDYWAELPGNVDEGKGRIKMQAAYTAWKTAHDAEMKLRRQAEKARTFNHFGPPPGEQSCSCGEKTYQRRMGEPCCYECARAARRAEEDAEDAARWAKEDAERNARIPCICQGPHAMPCSLALS